MNNQTYEDFYPYLILWLVSVRYGTGKNLSIYSKCESCHSIIPRRAGHRPWEALDGWWPTLFEAPNPCPQIWSLSKKFGEIFAKLSRTRLTMKDADSFLSLLEELDPPKSNPETKKWNLPSLIDTWLCLSEFVLRDGFPDTYTIGSLRTHIVVGPTRLHVSNHQGRETSYTQIHFYRTYSLVHSIALTHSLASDRRSIVMDGPMSLKWGYVAHFKSLHPFNWLSLFNFSPWTRPFTSPCSLCLPTTSGGEITQRCHHQDRGLFPWSETC